MRADAGAAVHWDLLLRSGLEAERVTRVARVLSSVPARTAEPVTDGVRDRAGAPGPGRPAARRRRPSGTSSGSVGSRRAWPKVSVVIPTRHNRTMLATCLPSLARTDYPDFEVVIVDNGGRTPENEQWYADNDHGLGLDVLWWDVTPFNYSAVNNAGGPRATSGEVLVFLNDDTEVLDPSWMKELVGWAVEPEIGIVGPAAHRPRRPHPARRRDPRAGGFADHVFEGMRPRQRQHLRAHRLVPQHPGRHRRLLRGASATVFDQLGGFDERFILCGSDVALGLDATLVGLRNLCSPFAGLRHLESATRGTTVPTDDFFASYWRYNTWLFGGDPYCNPNLSLGSRTPALRSPHEPTPQQRVAVPLGRKFAAFRQKSDAAESTMLADMCRALPTDQQRNDELHARNAEPFEVRTVNWYIPDIDSPFYGGINTALRIADHLPARRASRTGSSCGAARRTTSSGRRWPRRSRLWRTREIVFYDGTQASLDRGAGVPMSRSPRYG